MYDKTGSQSKCSLDTADPLQIRLSLGFCSPDFSGHGWRSERVSFHRFMTLRMDVHDLSPFVGAGSHGDGTILLTSQTKLLITLRGI